MAPDEEPPTEIQDGRDALDTALKNRRWLMVLDDVWRCADLRAFEVADTPSRFFITTRDEGVVRASGAVPHVVDELTQPAARAFLARGRRYREAELPPAADDMIRECGRLPLALALAGATLADDPKNETLWRDVVAALQRPTMINCGPSSTIPIRTRSPRYRRASISCCRGPGSLPELAIFPEDTPIPTAPLKKLWGIAGLKLRSRIKLFVDRALARRQDDGSILLHDLQGDFVRKRCPNVSAAHERLLEGYRPDTAMIWAEIEDDGYSSNLSLHKAQAG